MNMTVSLRTPGALLHHGEAAALSARAEYGAFGMLPNHADVAIALAPSVLSLREADGSERVFGIDEGLLVKRGDQVSIAVRRAVEGPDLHDLQAIVRARFIEVDEHERTARAAQSRLEADMVRGFGKLKETR
jgi:F-type H+-transporting ATPase subunit epsilon